MLADKFILINSCQWKENLKKKKNSTLKGFLERRAEICLQEYSNNLPAVSNEQLYVCDIAG